MNRAATILFLAWILHVRFLVDCMVHYLACTFMINQVIYALIMDEQKHLTEIFPIKVNSFYYYLSLNTKTKYGLVLAYSNAS